jgi:hypothetical protein
MARVTDTLRSEPRRSEQGFVLLYASILGLLAMGLWMLAWRGTHDTIRTEKFEVTRNVRSESVMQAMGWALNLLGTGRPPSDPYACIFTVPGSSTSHDCTVIFTSAGDEDHWQVEATPATSAELGSLPPAPSTFGT